MFHSGRVAACKLTFRRHLATHWTHAVGIRSCKLSKSRGSRSGLKRGVVKIFQFSETEQSIEHLEWPGTSRVYFSR